MIMMQLDWHPADIIASLAAVPVNQGCRRPR